LKRWIIVLLAGLVPACAALFHVEAPRVSVASVTLEHLGLVEQRFGIGLRVENPNDFDFTVEALDFDIEVNGKPFAHGLARAATRVPALSTSVVKVEATTASRALLEQLKGLSSEGLKRGVPYRIVGRARIDKLGDWVPFEYKGVYGSEPPEPALRTRETR